jgi:hypothetical protein
MILKDYLHFTSSSKSPESYHIWTLLSMIASVLGKKTWIKCNYFNVYPNLYIILASMPGVGGKSTTMRIGRSVVKDANLDIYYSNDAQSPQALMLELKNSFRVHQIANSKQFYGYSAVTVLASELVSLLISGPVMVDFLTDVYDSDTKYEYRTKNSGSIMIENPCLNIITGVTTENLNSRIIRDAAAGGFMSRSIIVYDNDTRHSSAFDLPEASQLAARQKVVNQFVGINDLYGEMSFTAEAKRIYQAFEIEEARAMSSQLAYVEFRSRKPIHVLKVAMLIAASELRMVINEQDVAIAIEILNRVEYNMKYIHLGTGGHKHAEINNRVIMTLGRVDSLDYVELVEQFISTSDEETIRKAVETMVQVNWIALTKEQTPEGKTKAILRLTEKGRDKFNRYN